MTDTQPPFERLAIIGLGLIGSSISHAVRAHGVAGTVVGFDAAPEIRTRARDLGLGDIVDDIGDAVRGADFVILAIPVGAVGAAASAIAPYLEAGAIVSDTGSVKESILRDVAPQLPKGVHLVPSHPVAGTEFSGPDAGFAALFEKRWCILTPAADTDPAAVERVAAFWRALGSKTEVMDAAHHDRVLAITSHLPHLIAYNIVRTADDLETVTESEVFKYSAGGFRDFTRIAASDPVMWRDIFLNNKEAVLEMLGRFTEDLSALQRAIRWGDAETLEALFRRTRDIRRGIIAAGQDEPEHLKKS
ncbi:MAG: prephenate/arogenate dehydrogenase family protein [Proteobacteria bacterium]|nr:prephenate/arogenate dehydrogenase family protein [Pseudomonadota bacterium]MDA1059864.1 prephenate/arogenate dehydrogenase family protein [Pseudomonadota bacterium]